jgi:AcrR family transcriptional regulator
MSPRPGLDTARVVQAAAGLVNEGGLESLTLNRVAENLGVQTPSLYNHVDGLPGLRRELALLSTRTLGQRLAEAAIGRSGSEAVVALAQAYRAYIQENPGLYAAGLRASGTQPAPDERQQAAEERVVQVGLAVMGSFGLKGEDALHALRAFRSLVHGFATLEAAGGFGLPLDCDESFRRLVEMFVGSLQPCSSAGEAGQ